MLYNPNNEWKRETWYHTQSKTFKNTIRIFWYVISRLTFYHTISSSPVIMVIGAIIFGYIIRSISSLARDPNLSQVLTILKHLSFFVQCLLSK